MRSSRKMHLLLLCLLAVGMLAGCKDRISPGEEKAEIGKPAPDFILEDLNGRTWRLSELRGQEVFLNFWATWCPPCREEMPSMDALYREMRLAGKPFQMLAVLSNDDPAQAERFASKADLTFPILKDPEGLAARAYRITGVPETFIIDSRGILQAKIVGGADWVSADARRLINQHLP